MTKYGKLKNVLLGGRQKDDLRAMIFLIGNERYYGEFPRYKYFEFHRGDIVRIRYDVALSQKNKKPINKLISIDMLSELSDHSSIGTRFYYIV